MPEKHSIGVIGLGAMGLNMALCLVDAGYEVTGFDINTEAASKLRSQGGLVAETLRHVAMRADVLIIMVATSMQTTSILSGKNNGVVSSLPTNSIILLCITAAPEYVLEVRGLLDTMGRSDLKLVDCPVSGGEERARHGTLSLLCSGERKDIDSMDGVMSCLSSQLHLIPGGLGAAMGVKMVHQILVGVHILASVEMMALASTMGLDLKSTYDAVMESDAASWLFGQRAAHMMDKTKVPASSLLIISKDLAMLNACGRQNHFPLPLAALVHQQFVQAISAGYEASDDCNVINLYLFGENSFERSYGQTRTSTTSRSNFSKTSIVNLLTGIHTAVAIEVLKFAKHLGLDIMLLQKIVNDAAGSSKMFKRICSSILGAPETSLKTFVDDEQIASNMASAMETVEALNYPLFLSSAALQQLFNY